MATKKTASAISRAKASKSVGARAGLLEAKHRREREKCLEGIDQLCAKLPDSPELVAFRDMVLRSLDLLGYFPEQWIVSRTLFDRARLEIERVILNLSEDADARHLGAMRPRVCAAPPSSSAVA